MSEVINNVSRRKETLKNVLRQLHEGKQVDAVLEEFGSLAKEASSSEIAQIEQMLVDEGLPVEEIQRLCDVHVAVFRGGLDTQTPAETLPGHPIHTFRAENKMALGFLNGLKLKVAAYLQIPNEETLHQACIQLTKVCLYEVHYQRKENLLFPYLEKYGFSGPSKVMWGIHDQIRAMFRQMTDLLSKTPGSDLEQVAAIYPELDQAVREMFYKEEKILFPAAISHLTLPDWIHIHDQEEEIGFFSVRPGNQWPAPQIPASETGNTQATNASAQSSTLTGMLPLDTGALTLEQINLMLCNLPVDVTYVDENDEVRYFSQTRERIFPRLPAIIGRKVQNCHPPQSVNRVQQILDDFRAGVRDAAEFWIQMNGRFIHIRYFALRDGQQRYRGTLEVSQDATAIRSLEGERRLLDEAPPIPHL